MLHTETVSLGTLELLKSLMQDELMAQFVLVGGASLSLQLGHRISLDWIYFLQLLLMKGNYPLI